DTPTEAAIAGTGEGAANAESTPAAKKKSQPRQKKTGFSWWPKLAWAGAGFAVLAVAAWFAWQKTREPDVKQFVAQAYTEKRPFDLRFPGAKFAPVRKERGGDQIEPTSLKEAVYLISKNLDENPHDPYWLEANGSALLLVGDPQNKAIDSYKQALDSQPGS